MNINKKAAVGHSTKITRMSVFFSTIICQKKSFRISSVSSEKSIDDVMKSDGRGRQQQMSCAQKQNETT
jgi:hypothetical protein